MGPRFALICDEGFLGGTRAVVRRLIQQYEPVLNLFSKKSSPYTFLLAKALSGRRALVCPLLNVHVWAGTGMSLIRHAFEQEVSGADLETLFRMDTTFMQLISDAMKLSGRLYLADFVKSLLKKVTKLAHRMGSCDWKKEAAGLFEKFGRKILRSTLPPMMKKILDAGTKACQPLFPTIEDASKRIVIALFFLRFLVPAIVSPARFLVTPPTISANELTILKFVGRGVQSLASSSGGSTLSADMKESFLSLKKEMDEFCTAFAKNDPIPDGMTHLNWDEILPSISQIHLFMSNDFNHLVSYLSGNPSPCPSPIPLASPTASAIASPLSSPTASGISSPLSSPHSSPVSSPQVSSFVSSANDLQLPSEPSPRDPISRDFDLSNLPPALVSPRELPYLLPSTSSTSFFGSQPRGELSSHSSCPLPNPMVSPREGGKGGEEMEGSLKAALEDCTMRKLEFPSYFPHRPKDFLTPLLNVPWKKEEFFTWWPIERSLHQFSIVLYFSKVSFLFSPPFSSLPELTLSNYSTAFRNS